MAIEDLQLRPGEAQTLKSCSKDFRAALWKAGEHKCLTTYPECCRKTAIELREYYRTLTLSPANRVPEYDDTQEDRDRERMKQYFQTRNVHS